MADTQKQTAFRAIAKDDPSTLGGITASCPKQEWEKWRNQAGQSLITVCRERGAFKSYAVLAKALDLSLEIGKGDNGEPSKKAFRAVARDDMVALVEVLNGLSAEKWLQWRNKAGKDLLTMSRERNSKGVYATLRRALASPLKAEGLVTQPPPAATEAVKAPAAEVKAEAAPIAVVAVDVDGDGKADFIVAGVDKDKDGIPDALEDPEEVRRRIAEEEKKKKAADDEKQRAAEEDKKRATEEEAKKQAEEAKKAAPDLQRKQSPPPARKSIFVDPELEAKLARQAEKAAEEPGVSAAATPKPPVSPRVGSPRPKEDGDAAQAARIKSAEDSRKRMEERKAKEQAEKEIKAKNQAELDARLAKQASKAAGSEIVGQGTAEAAKAPAPAKAPEAAPAAAQEPKAPRHTETVMNAVSEESKQKGLEEAQKQIEENAKKAAEEAAAKAASEKAAKEEAEKKAEAQKQAAAAENAAKEEAEKKAKAAADAAAKKAAEEKAKIAPAKLEGKVNKKGKGGMFRKAWDARIAVVKDGVFAYYKEQKDVGRDPAGVLDFRPCACEVVPEPTDKGGTQFIIRPKSGNWTGQNFKGADEGREFVFDTAGSEHGRSAWIQSISAHCEWATRQKR